MRLLLPFLLLPMFGCGACFERERQSTEYEPEPCAGTSEVDNYNPRAIAGANPPKLEVEPIPLLLTTDRPEGDLRLMNTHSGCLRIGDVAIVQTTQTDLALHPGEHWFESAEFLENDELTLSVRWDQDLGPVEGFVVVQSNDPSSNGGISEFPIEAGSGED